MLWVMAAGWLDWLKIDFRTHVHLNEGTCHLGQLCQPCLWEIRNYIYIYNSFTYNDYVLKDAKLYCVWWTINFFNIFCYWLKCWYSTKQKNVQWQQISLFFCQNIESHSAMQYNKILNLLIVTTTIKNYFMVIFKHSQHPKYFVA